MAHDFAVGDSLTWLRVNFIVVERTGDQLILSRKRSGKLRRISTTELTAAVEDGEAVLHAPPPDATAQLPLLDCTDAKAGDAVERRRAYVTEVGSRYGDRAFVQQAIDRVVVRLNDNRRPGVSTVHSWCKRVADNGNDLRALLPHFKERGNRRSRFKAEVIDLFLKTMDEFYLQPNRPTIAAAHQWMADMLIDANQSKKQRRLRMPSYRAFRCWVRDWLDPFWVVARRFGRVAALRRFHAQGASVVTTFPLQRVEIDHTVLDEQVVHPITNANLGRPTFTWALDHYSRVILGFHLSLQPPSAVLVLQCLQQVMRDKTGLLKDIPGFANLGWGMCGIPVSIVVDNGAEFHGEALREACQRFGISIQFCPPGQPWFKGRTERFVGTLNTGLVHLLPGTTRSNPRAREDYPSEQLASLTLDELQRLITQWIVSTYHERRHRILGESPRAAWEAGVSEQPARLVTDPTTLELDLAITRQATIHSGRIQVETMHFASSALAALEFRLGKANRKVKVSLTPNDVSRAFIHDPIKKVLIEVPCITRGVTSGMSLDAFRMLRKMSTAGQGPAGSINDAARQLQRDICDQHKAAVKQAAQAEQRASPVPKQKKDSKISLKEQARAEVGMAATPPVRPQPVHPKSSDARGRYAFSLDECSVATRSPTTRRAR